MYGTAGACFTRSGVTKMPLITVSHFFAPSAGIRPGNAVLFALALAPHVFASASAMSTSKPLILPLDEASSIGGNVGSVQNVNVDARGDAPAAPAPTTAATSTSRIAALRIARLLSLE